MGRYEGVGERGCAVDAAGSSTLEGGGKREEGSERLPRERGRTGKGSRAVKSARRARRKVESLAK